MKDNLSQGAREAAEIQAKNYLNEMAKSLTAEGVAVETEIIDGTVADEILNYSEENDIDLIIMSTHGKSGLSRWFFRQRRRPGYPSFDGARCLSLSRVAAG